MNPCCFSILFCDIANATSCIILQDKLLKFYGNASSFIQQTYSNWGDRDPKVIQNAFGGFLGGVGNMLESVVTTRAENATNATKRRERSDVSCIRL